MSGCQRGGVQHKNRNVCVIHEDFEQHMSPDRGCAISH